MKIELFDLPELRRGLKNTSFLVAGNVAIQIISFFAAVYIARKLGPDNYGIYSTVIAFVAMFAFITLPGFNNTLVREGSYNVKKLGEILKKVIGLQIWMSVFAIVVTITVSLLISYKSNVKIYIAVFSGTLLISAMKESLNSVYQVSERMQFISILRLINYGLYATLAVIFLYLGYGVLALIIINISANLISLILSYIISKKITPYKFSLNPGIEKVLLKSGIIFSLITFFGFLYSKVDIVMASIFLTSKDVGIYSVGYRLVRMASMIWGMVSLAFFPIIVKRFKHGPIRAKSFFQLSLIIFVVVAPICLVVSIFSKQIIFFLFGAQYEGADRILRILIWVLVLANPTWPFVWAMKANYHEKKVLYVTPLRSASNIILNYILLRKFGIIGIAYSTIITYLWYMIFINFGYQYYILKKAGNIY